MRNIGLVTLFVLCVPARAEMPNNITDPKTQEVLEYLDTKLNSATKRLNNLTGGISGTLIQISQGGTGATTASGARSNLLVPSTTGTGASGTWGINITGNAATATDSSKVAKTGDTMTGVLTNASGFVGPLTGAASLNVLKTGDVMTGPLTAGVITSTSSITSGDGTPNSGNLLVYGGATFANAGMTDNQFVISASASGYEVFDPPATSHIRVALAQDTFFNTPYYNFGIGTQTPGYKLEVDGDAHITSSMTVDGGIYGEFYGDGTGLTGVIFSTAAIVLSTGIIQAELDLVILSTAALDAATDANTASTIVKRDADKGFWLTALKLEEVNALPTTGYSRGTLIYLDSDPTHIYLSTETVVSADSWLAK